MSGENLLYSNLVPRKRILQRNMSVYNNRILQRNMSVYNNRGNELLIVPSRVIEEALSRLCEFYIYKAGQLVGYQGRKELYDLIENPINFNSIFYNDDIQQNGMNQEEEIFPPVDNINRVKNVLKLLKNTKEHNNEVNSENTSIFYINRILMLLNIYEKNYFIPFVALENPIKNYEYYHLQYSIDMITKISLVNRDFFVLGSQEFSFPLEIQQSASNHIKILSPEGMVFQYAYITNIKDPILKEKFRSLYEYLDDDMIYFYVSPEESDKIVEEWEETGEIPSNEEQKGIESDDQGPVINCGIGVSNRSLKGLSLIRILIFLMYISIFIPALTIIVFNHDIILSSILGIAVLTLTIIIAIGIYSIDKPFLELYVAGQIVIATFLFIIECVCLYLKY